MNLFSVGWGLNWLWEALNTLWFMICGAIYPFINFLYMVFEKVASVNLFSEEVFDKITGRIYVVMGIAMLFIFAYNLVLMIINPEDKKSTGSTTKVIKETMISLVVVILLPTIFNWMYTVQSHILESNVLGAVILGGIGSNNDVCEAGSFDYYECECQFNNYPVNLSNYKGKNSSNIVKELESNCKSYKALNGSKRGARSIPATIFTAFYSPNNFSYDKCKEYLLTGNDSLINDSKDQQVCTNYYVDVQNSKYSGNIMYFWGDSYLTDVLADSDDDSMRFDWLLAIIAGAFAVWVFLCYAMEIGVRVAKLGLLQILAPIPVMLRIIPGQKEKMYDKWFKNLMNTYLDVFIRVAIIYFSLFAISLVPDVIETLWASNSTGDGGFIVKTLSLVIVILGILKFAQECPDLLKEFIGNSGRFKIRSPKAQFNENKLAKGTLGAAGTLAAIGSKNIVDTARNIRSEGWKKGLAKSAKGIPRSIGQGFGGAVRGFKNAQGANSFGEMRDNIFSSASTELSKASLGQKLEGFGVENKDAFSGFYRATYSAYNSPAELRKAQKLDEVAKKYEAIEGILDGSDQVKAVNSYYEEAIKNAQSSGASVDDIQRLYKTWNDERNKARGKAYDDKKGTEELKMAVESYKSSLGQNLSIVNESLEANGNTTISSVDDLFGSDGITLDVEYKNFRNTGNNSKKHAAAIRNQAIAEQQKTKGDK